MDEAQFVALIGQHQGIIHKICRLYRNTKEDREDLFQEIVFHTWRSLPAFEGRAKISSWIYRIALNTAMATFREKKPAISYMEIVPEQAGEPADPEAEFQSARLLAALQKLEPAEKAIITLYLEDLSYQEIGEIIGINENYVGVKLNRIKSKIQQLLKD